MIRYNLLVIRSQAQYIALCQEADTMVMQPLTGFKLEGLILPRVTFIERPPLAEMHALVLMGWSRMTGMYVGCSFRDRQTLTHCCSYNVKSSHRNKEQRR